MFWFGVANSSKDSPLEDFTFSLLFILFWLVFVCDHETRNIIHVFDNLSISARFLFRLTWLYDNFFLPSRTSGLYQYFVVFFADREVRPNTTTAMAKRLMAMISRPAFTWWTVLGFDS